MSEPKLNRDLVKALLIGVSPKGRLPESARESVDELERLVETAEVSVAGKIVQHQDKPDGRTLIGRGKVEEIGELCSLRRIDMVIFDEQLTPTQQRNLENHLEVAVIDRTLLILDIFARRALSNEGKLQVELAQLKYLLPRLIGKGLIISRTGGGIGTRGPGETQLEIDRRRANQRIHKLEKRLETVKKSRRVQRAGRKSQQLPAIAVVGYTNAGKSTLFNALTHADVLTGDKLFATLDPTIRKLALPDGGSAVISDTVGFIRKLPHELVTAFKATLEEVAEADVLIHVIDASSTSREEQAAEVYKVLEEIDARDKPVIEALNKIDLVETDLEVKRLCFQFENGVPVSAGREQGVDALLKSIEETLYPVIRHIKCAIPYQRGDVISMIHDKGKVFRQEYRPHDVLIEANMEYRFAQSLEPYEVKGE